MIRTVFVILTGLAMMLVCDPTTGAITVGKDDPATYINESVVLDTTRFEIAGGIDNSPSPMETVEAYALDKGWSCTTPADGELDDIFLGVKVEPLTGETTTYVVEMDLDMALDSQGKRVVLLACDA